MKGIRRTESRSRSAEKVDETPSARRAIGYPINAFLTLAIVAVANFAVYFAGREWFVQTPSLFVPIRNIGTIALIVVFGRLLLPRVSRRAENILLVACALFGVGLAMQFRLGHEAPRQLSGRDVEIVRDSVMFEMPGMEEDTIGKVVAKRVGARNATLRRDFEQSRIDIRLARSLEEEYGPSDTTSQFLNNRETAPTDPLFFRLLPVLAVLGGIVLFARVRIMPLITSQWRAIGLWGSLGICLVTFFYLGSVGGIRGSTLAPQELLKFSIPIAWAGLLVRYRGVLLAESLSRMSTNPIALWLYVLGLMALPLAVFIAVRDFGQFLAIGLAQTLLLGWFTRNSTYVVLFTSGFLIAAVALLGESILPAAPIAIILAIILVAGLTLAAMERFRTKESLWPTAAAVLAGFGIVTWLISGLPLVSDLLATPRGRFSLWADLYARNGDPMWWDRVRQVVESLFALDAGGITGEGIGSGSPFLIPKAGSDFIFAALVEEMGFIGGLLIILGFVALVVLGLTIADEKGRRSFAGLLVAGFVLMLASQAFVHIAGVMNVMPMTGITLPLVSSGMSSTVATWLIVGAIVGLAARKEVQSGEIVIRRDLQKGTPAG